MLGLTSGLPTTVSTASQIQGFFSWAYAMAGLVAVVFIIKGGVEYMISRVIRGECRRRHGVWSMQWLVLIIVILASVITNVVMKSSIGGSAVMRKIGLVIFGVVLALFWCICDGCRTGNGGG